MKKKVILAFLLVVFSFLVACNIGNDNEYKVIDTEECNRESQNIEGDKEDTQKIHVKNADIVISDENFITDMDNVFNDIDKYIGKTMKVEGFVGSIAGNQFKILRLYDMVHEDHSHEVTVGINAVYDGEIPAENTWVEAFGTVTKANMESREQPVLNVKKIEKKFTHGQTKVYN